MAKHENTINLNLFINNFTNKYISMLYLVFAFFFAFSKKLLNLVILCMQRMQRILITLVLWVQSTKAIKNQNTNGKNQLINNMLFINCCLWCSAPKQLKFFALLFTSWFLLAKTRQNNRNFNYFGALHQWLFISWFLQSKNQGVTKLGYFLHAKNNQV